MTDSLSIPLAYGRDRLAVAFPAGRTDVIEPRSAPGLPDERAAFRAALDRPTAGPSLRERLRPAQRLCIVFTDITRATPNDRLIPWLLEELADHPRDTITLVNGLGTHRPNTPAELDALLTPAVARGWRVVNHEPDNPAELRPVGRLDNGRPALINRRVAEADLRILTGFIEPHFFAGFSGGPKGVLPSIAGAESVVSNHAPRMVGHPQARWGVTVGNPLWEEMLEAARMTRPTMLLNVAYLVIMGALGIRIATRRLRMLLQP